MKAEIVAVGTELLMGQIANTDAQYLSKKLSELGIDVFYHHVVGDNANRLKKLLETIIDRCDVIITTGGIGPTQETEQDPQRESHHSVPRHVLCLCRYPSAIFNLVESRD